MNPVTSYLLCPALFSFSGCPSQTQFLDYNDGGLADLISLLKYAYMEWEGAIVCGYMGSKCYPILWSKTQKIIVLDKDCEKETDIRMDPQIDPQEPVACTSGRKRRKCGILCYNIKPKLQEPLNNATNQSFTLVYEIMSIFLLQHTHQMNH